MSFHSDRRIRATFACALLLWVPVLAAATPASPPAVADVHEQVHRSWSFPADGVRFSNTLPCARLNGVERVGADHYRVRVAPESLPINPSPWYGFAVRSRTPRELVVDFRFEHGRSRYWPKLSDDGGAHWRKAADDAFRVDADGGATLHVRTGPEPLRVYAQRPVCNDALHAWERRLAQHVELRRETIGRSVQGRPLRMFAFGRADARDVLVVIGRQHPPEVTGSQALMPFVDALAGDTAQARHFRRHTRVLVVPVVNPDGVAEGHWRGNAHGVDLNRDWGRFTQPETRAVRDALERRIGQRGRRVVFAIDFHSTWNDVFYTVAEDPSLRPGGAMRRWIDGMRARYPGRIREKNYSADKSTVFKNWAFRRFHAPAVTYEVGDKTPPAELQALARFAAGSLMRILRDGED